MAELGRRIAPSAEGLDRLSQRGLHPIVFVRCAPDLVGRPSWVALETRARVPVIRGRLEVTCIHRRCRAATTPSSIDRQGLFWLLMFS